MIDGKPLALEQAVVKPGGAKQNAPAQTFKIKGVADEIRVTCVGDSNTQRGYPRILQNLLGKGWKMENCGIGAATLIEGTLRPYHKMKHYQTALASDPDYVIIMLGTNDASPRWWTDSRKTTFKGDLLPEFKSRYLTLIDSLQALESKPQIILAIPLSVYPERAPKQHKESAQGRKKNLQNDIIPIIQEIAKEKGLPLVDLQAHMGNTPELSADGVHLTKEGYTKMCAAFRDELLKPAKKPNRKKKKK